MSESKKDRLIAPSGQGNSKKSKARDVRDRNKAPPRVVTRPVGKPKKGERVMDAQLAQRHQPEADVPPAPVERRQPEVIDVTPEKDPWWTDERDRVYVLTVQGIPKTQIARELGRDRGTIGAWQDDDRFASRLQEENLDRFRASRQRRTIQTLRLTDKAHGLADKMLDLADENPKDLNARLAARDWLNEFREQSRREDEIYGLDKQRVDVNVHGTVGHEHNHKGSVNVSFKEFLTKAMTNLGVDVENEEISTERADEALAAITERALSEGTFLDDLVEREKQELLLAQASGRGR